MNPLGPRVLGHEVRVYCRCWPCSSSSQETSPSLKMMRYLGHSLITLDRSTLTARSFVSKCHFPRNCLEYIGLADSICGSLANSSRHGACPRAHRSVPSSGHVHRRPATRPRDNRPGTSHLSHIVAVGEYVCMLLSSHVLDTTAFSTIIITIVCGPSELS